MEISCSQPQKVDVGTVEKNTVLEDIPEDMSQVLNQKGELQEQESVETLSQGPETKRHKESYYVDIVSDLLITETGGKGEPVLKKGSGKAADFMANNRKESEEDKGEDNGKFEALLLQENKELKEVCTMMNNNLERYKMLVNQYDEGMAKVVKENYTLRKKYEQLVKEAKRLSGNNSRGLENRAKQVSFQLQDRVDNDQVECHWSRKDIAYLKPESSTQVAFLNEETSKERISRNSEIQKNKSDEMVQQQDRASPHRTASRPSVTSAKTSSTTLPSSSPELEATSLISITPFLQTSGLYVNCSVQLPQDIVILGTTDGLHSLHLDSGAVVPIAGVTGEVTAIRVAELPGVVLLQVGDALMYLWKEVLIIAAKAHKVAKPAVEAKLLKGQPQGCVKFDVGSYYLCVATRRKLSLFRWEFPTEEKMYVLRATFNIPGEEPCTSLLFTNSSFVLLACNRLIEIDVSSDTLPTYDSLDTSDPSLTPSSVGHPLAVVQIGGEMMVAFRKVGIFVNSLSGRRSRDKDVKWRGELQQLAYRKPHLFVFYVDSVQIIRVDSKAYQSEDSVVDSSVEALQYCKYLGVADTAGSVYARSIVDGQPTTVKLEGVRRNDESDLSVTSSDSHDWSVFEKELDQIADAHMKPSTTTFTTSSASMCFNRG